MSINERIKFLIDCYEGGTVLRFAKKIGVPHTSVAGMLPGSRESKPGFEIIAKILEAYPAVHSDWLIKGIGEIPGNAEPLPVPGPTFHNIGNPINKIRVGGAEAASNPEAAFWKERYEEAKKECAELKQANTNLLEKLINSLGSK